MKSIEAKTDNMVKGFDVSKYVDNTTRGRKSVQGVSFTKYGINAMKDFFKHFLYNGCRYKLKSEYVESLAQNMQNVKNWHIANNVVFCTNEKTLRLKGDDYILQRKRWSCDIAKKTKSDILYEYILLDNAHYKSSDVAKAMLKDWNNQDSDKIEAMKNTPNDVQTLLKCCDTISK